MALTLTHIRGAIYKNNIDQKTCIVHKIRATEETYKWLIEFFGGQENRNAYVHTWYRYTTIQCKKYIQSPVDLQFYPTDSYNVKGIAPSTEEEIDIRRQIFGTNCITIPQKSTLTLLKDEIIHPFNVFQILSIVLWTYDEYYIYGSCIALITIVSIIQTLLETKKNISKLVQVAEHVIPIQVYRLDTWIETTSEDLVPGDIFQPEQNMILPCDAHMLMGDVICNEAPLTGESVPVSKLCKTSTIQLAEEDKYTLFAGTKILRVRSVKKEPSKAQVIRTGFDTTKGELVRAMLFPQDTNFSFYRDSWYFLGGMSIIACLGFISTLIIYIQKGVPAGLIAVRALDLITIVIPPALPATMQIGTTFALARLRKRQIICISPPRVNISGKLDVMVFDKTGTLTEDGLDVLGVQPKGNISMLSDVSHYSTLITHALATCHSIKVVNGELLGDPLDLQMFKKTGWELDETEALGVVCTARPPNSEVDLDTLLAGGAQEVGIVKIFDFNTNLRRMSVLVKRPQDAQMEVFCKGAPEAVNSLCIASSIPHDFDKLLGEYTRSGYRVIALATKQLAIDWYDAQTVDRGIVEVDLHFLGFIIFENKVKSFTKGVLHSLTAAGIPQIMATGDNLHTAISVGQECGIIDPHVKIFYASLTGPVSSLEWRSLADPNITLDSVTLFQYAETAHNSVESLVTMQDMNTIELAMTGEQFDYLMEVETPDTKRKILDRARILARMSPEQKQLLVETLRDFGFCTGMCGDGANDCGALKAADVGISLSDAEASVASSFTSRNTEITCVIDVIREGRAALVTSFSCFKFMALYSMIQFTSAILLYSLKSDLADMQFLYIDMAIIIPLAFFMGRTEASTYLHHHAPSAQLISPKVLVSAIGHMILQAIFQIWAFFHIKHAKWYIPPIPEEIRGRKDVESMENTGLFLLSSFMYIVVALIFSSGKPFRKDISSNVPYVATVGCLLILTLYLVIYPAQWVISLMQFVDIPWMLRSQIIGLAVIYALLALWCEMWIFPKLCDSSARRRRINKYTNGRLLEH